MVSQNHPFTPIRDAWEAGSRNMLPLDDDLARRQVEEILAKVLSNRKPPYPITGGLFDAMSDTGGKVLIATNSEAEEAAGLFEQTEGIDLHPAAAIATATLVNAVRDGLVQKESLIMLNITGGGEKRFAAENELYYLEPDLVFDIDPNPEEVKKKIQNLW